MIIEYNDRKIEITDYDYWEGGFAVYSANYIDGNMEDLTSRELSDLERNYTMQMYDKMSKGTGY